MKATQKSTFAVVACTCVAFAVVSLVGFLFIPRTPAFWIGWGFTGAAYGLCAVLTIQTIHQNKETSFIKLPTCMVAVAYAIVQSAASLVLALTAASWTVALTVCAVLLALATAVLLALRAGTTYITARDQEIKDKRTFVADLTVDLRVARDTVNSPTASRALVALAEDLNYSDPMGCDVTQAIETKIRSLVANARMAAKQGNDAEVESLCRQARSLLTERNARCRNTK